MSIKNIAVLLGMAAVGFGANVAATNYYQNGFFDKAQSIGCVRLGPPPDKTAPLAPYVKDAVACPSGSLIIITKGLI